MCSVFLIAKLRKRESMIDNKCKDNIEMAKESVFSVLQ